MSDLHRALLAVGLLFILAGLTRCALHSQPCVARVNEAHLHRILDRCQGYGSIAECPYRDELATEHERKLQQCRR